MVGHRSDPPKSYKLDPVNFLPKVTCYKGSAMTDWPGADIINEFIYNWYYNAFFI